MKLIKKIIQLTHLSCRPKIYQNLLGAVMHPIFQGILESKTLCELDQHCMLRGTTDVEQIVFDFHQHRLINPNHIIELFEFKLLYLHYRSIYLSSITLRTNEKRNHLYAAEFYQLLIAKLKISDEKKEMMQGFRLRVLILDNIANNLEVLVVRTLEDKIHYFDSGIRKEVDAEKLQALHLKKRLLEDALGQNYEIDDKLNIKHFLRVLDEERNSFRHETIAHCINYSSKHSKKQVKLLFSTEPLLLYLQEIYEQKIYKSLKKFGVHNSCLGKVKIHLLDLIREISFQSISTYGTLFQAKDSMNFTLDHPSLLINESRYQRSF